MLNELAINYNIIYSYIIMDIKEIEYWNKFYKNFIYLEPSDFAKFILQYISSYNTKMNILDLGCGNGRDSYFLSQKHDITGVDISNIPIDKLNCKFILDDMTTCDKSKYDLIYSRFTFHSITDDQQDILLSTIKKNTLLCIETRSINGLNTYREYGDGHYRNLTDINKLKKMLIKYEFDILYVNESDNCSIYKNENPICIRIICKKL